MRANMKNPTELSYIAPGKCFGSTQKYDWLDKVNKAQEIQTLPLGAGV